MKAGISIKILVTLVAVLCALSIGLVLNLVSGVFIPLVIAWFMLQIFRPVIDLGRKIKLPQSVNLILVFTVFFGLCYLGIVFCTTQIVEFNRILQQYSPKLNEMTVDIMKALQIPLESLPRINWMDILGRNLRSITENIFSISSQFILTLIFFMFMLLEAPFLNKKIDRAFSDSTAIRIKNIMSSVNNDISHYLGTLTLMSLMTAFLCWVVLKIMGVELATGWSILIFLLNFIPAVGSIIATVLPFTMAVLQFSPEYIQPIMVLLLVGTIQFTIGNILTPKLLGDKLGLSPVVIMLSLLLWGMIWGITGAILSVPIASIIKIVCENFEALSPIAVMMGGGEKQLPPAVPETGTQNEPEPKSESGAGIKTGGEINTNSQSK
ncbi:MAG: AI-2E family transporter [Synergistaceae bacterium]|nr:AI-2E family transporter [Synergistaceae bacterium]